MQEKNSKKVSRVNKTYTKKRNNESPEILDFFGPQDDSIFGPHTLYSIYDIAKYCDKTVPTIQKWIEKGIFSKPIKAGENLTLDLWLESVVIACVEQKDLVKELQWNKLGLY